MTKYGVRRRSFQPIIIGRKASKFLKSLSGNLWISGPDRGPNLHAGRRGAASLKISVSDLVEWSKEFSGMIKQKTEAPFVVL
jgi:hypothetical protein